MNMHGTQAIVLTNYTLGAVTIRKDPTKILVFQNKVYPQGVRIQYEDFKHLSTLSEDKMKIFSEQKPRPTIKLINRESPSSINEEQGRRILNPAYMELCPTLSENQELLMCTRFGKNDFDRFVDIFDCRDIVDFCDVMKPLLDQEDPNLLCSLNMKAANTATFRKILTSIERPNIIFAITERELLVFDIKDSLKSKESINGEGNEDSDSSHDFDKIEDPVYIYRL